MPAPADLKPQTPGEAPAAPEQTAPTTDSQSESADQAPSEQQDTPEQVAERESRAEMMTLVNGNADVLIKTLPRWTDAQLLQLRDLEVIAKNRSTVLSAIDAELKRNTPPVTPPTPAAPEIARGPVRTDTQPAPVLTNAGWVVPEPTPKA
ncbi:hypothetical protein [Stenotrophomonas acidaminiphila]|uniref:hypothetical protein n=1 Tax=Stenotrophomonas acidaminiphila TaxID=128780 RepID=UPI003D05CBFB